MFLHYDIIFIHIYINLFALLIAVGHTKPKAPDPIRTPKLSDLRRG